MALPWECYQEAIQSKTDCCDVCKYSEPTRKGDYIIIVPISNDLVWQIHYELLVTSYIYTQKHSSLGSSFRSTGISFITIPT